MGINLRCFGKPESCQRSLFFPNLLWLFFRETFKSRQVCNINFDAINPLSLSNLFHSFISCPFSRYPFHNDYKIIQQGCSFKPHRFPQCIILSTFTATSYQHTKRSLASEHVCSKGSRKWREGQYNIISRLPPSTVLLILFFFSYEMPSQKLLRLSLLRHSLWCTGYKWSPFLLSFHC